MTVIDTGDPRAAAAVDAIHAGDTARLRDLLAEHPELATAALGTEDANGMTRSLLHFATDWPGKPVVGKIRCAAHVPIEGRSPPFGKGRG